MSSHYSPTQHSQMAGESYELDVLIVVHEHILVALTGLYLSVFTKKRMFWSGVLAQM